MYYWKDGKMFKWGRRGTPQNAYIGLARFVWGFKNQNIPFTRYIGLKFWKTRVKKAGLTCVKARSFAREKLPSPTAFGAFDFVEMSESGVGEATRKKS